MKLKNLGFVLGGLAICEYSIGNNNIATYDVSTNSINFSQVSDIEHMMSLPDKLENLPIGSLPRNIGGPSSNTYGFRYSLEAAIGAYNQANPTKGGVCIDRTYNPLYPQVGHYENSRTLTNSATGYQQPRHAIYKITNEVGILVTIGTNNAWSQAITQDSGVIERYSSRVCAYDNIPSVIEAERGRFRGEYISTQLVLLSPPPNGILQLPESVRLLELEMKDSEQPTVNSGYVRVPIKTNRYYLNVKFNRTTIPVTFKTCSITGAKDQTVNMRQITMREFQEKGESEGGQFTISLQCDDGLTPLVTFSDVNTPENTGDYLTLSRDSTATGVGVRIYKSDDRVNPISYGPERQYATGAYYDMNSGKYIPVTNAQRSQINKGYWNFLGGANNTTSNRNPSVTFHAYYYKTNDNPQVGTVNAKMTYTFSYQ